VNGRTTCRRCGVAAVLASAATGLALATGQIAESKVVAPTASCSAEQKSAREAALLRFKQGMAAARHAYFKKHREAKLRRAFVKRQSARLRVLETAAACTVPALPPSSGESCTFKFPPNQGTFQFSEGPLSSDWLPPRGRVDAVLIFVDFPDAPGVNVSGLVPRLTTHVPWFDEVSYGRFNLSVTPVQSWFRLPRPTSSYAPRNQSVHHPDLFADAIAASDAAVDYSKYQAVLVVGARGWTQGLASPFLASPGRGVRADGAEIRYGVVLGGSVFNNGRAANTLNHEFLHTLGLPDVNGGNNSVGAWDPMGGDATNHLLGWHKWLLGWLDPAQLTCLSRPSQLEETVTQLDSRGGKKLVVVPTSATTAHVIEVRRRSGYDGTICKEGVLVYTVDSLRPSSQGPISVGNGGGCFPGGAPFEVGRAFDDANVKVEVLASDGRAFRVRVTKK
jgi:M6 family metalloprotease-like protein